MKTSQDVSPDWEELAAFVDGRLDGERRRRVEARLAEDPEYFEVFLRTSEDVEAFANQPRGGNRWRRLWWLAAAAVLGTLIVGLPRPSTSPDPLRHLDQPATHTVFEDPGWDVLPWSVTLGSAEPPRHLTDQNRAIRLGVTSVDLHLALAAGERRQAAAASRQLAALAEASGFTRQALFARDLALDLDNDRQLSDWRADLDALEVSLTEDLGADRLYWAAGRWLQTTRLAAKVGDEEAVAALMVEPPAAGEDPTLKQFRLEVQAFESRPRQEGLEPLIEWLESQGARLGG